jgi:hypothetical protein
MTDDTAPRYPVRPPAPGPAVVLDLVGLWEAVEEEMSARDMTQLKELSDLTGIDRNTLGRVRARAQHGERLIGQRGGINTNAVLTLATFVGHRLANHSRWARGPQSALTDPPPGPAPTPEEAHTAHLSE